MKYGSEFRKTEIRFEVFGKEYSFFAHEELLETCGEIRTAAKAKLDWLCSSGKTAEEILVEVGTFFEECLKKILGEKVFGEISESRKMNVQELSGLMCYVLSEIRKVFAVDGVPEDE